ncbi:HsdM family class I SAM-dependent methyltransferase [Nocardia takedensis]
MQTSGDPVPMVSASEISRLAGVTRATVSNWRRRHDDFPVPVGGTENRPLFALDTVRDWLTGHGLDITRAPAADLRTLLRARVKPVDVVGLMSTLSVVDGRWKIAGRPYEEATDALLAALDRVTADHGVRATTDILAERGLEDTAASGVYGTPEAVAALMAALLCVDEAPKEVLDPACGGGTLLSAAHECGASELYGQDVRDVQVARARLTVAAQTGVVPRIRLGDSLSADAFAGREVAAVLCNPPYGQRDWGSAELAFDPRWEFGLPPRGESELAWVQHAVAHLRPGGTAVLLLPPAVASRGSGRRIRANLVRTGTLRAVIGLAPGAAQPWHIGLHIWMLRRSDGGQPSESLLFIDADSASPDRSASEERIVESVRVFLGRSPRRAAEAGLATVARLVDVLDETVDLTPARYVRTDLEPRAVADHLAASVETLNESTARLVERVAELTSPRVSTEGSWRTVTIAELVNHGQLEWIRAVPGGSVRSDSDARPVLTALDISTGDPASATTATLAPADTTVLITGDILVPAVRSDRRRGRTARVAGTEDAGVLRGPHVHLLRVDPTSLDPWFVAGFLAGGENQPMTHTATVRFDPSRLRLPVLPLSEQRRYGAEFLRLHLLRVAARRAADAADQAVELMTAGLTVGALEPQGRGARK